MLRFTDGFGFNPWPADAIGRDAERLPSSDVRDYQDTFNVNRCDTNNETWFDSDPVATDSDLTIMSEDEFIYTFVL